MVLGTRLVHSCLCWYRHLALLIALGIEVLVPGECRRVARQYGPQAGSTSVIALAFRLCHGSAGGCGSRTVPAGCKPRLSRAAKAHPPSSLASGEADLPSGIRLACLFVSPGTKNITYYTKITFIAVWSIPLFDRMGLLEFGFVTGHLGHNRENYVTDSPIAPMARRLPQQGCGGSRSHVVRALKLPDSFDVAPVENTFN